MLSVVAAKNGSIVAVFASSISFMSDSLIAFHPAIEDPSNITPSAKVSSSIWLISMVTCCHLPRGPQVRSGIRGGNEEDRGDHQALQARRGEGGAPRSRPPGHYRHGSQGLRAAKGAHRTLSW